MDESTLQTMHFVKALLEYADALGDIFRGLNSISLGSDSSASEKRKALGQYLSKCLTCMVCNTDCSVPLSVRVLDALNLNMENKAKNYESPHLAAIFLLNNFHFVHKTFSQ